MKKRTISCWGSVLVLLAVCPALAGDAGSLEFEVTFDEALRSTPFSGRVYVLLNDKPATPLLGKLLHRPPSDWSWTSRQPIFSLDVANWKPGRPLLIRNPKGYPYDLKDLPSKQYRLRAVMHTDPGLAHSTGAPGNLYGDWIQRDLDPATSGVVKLHIDQRIKSKERKPPIERVVELRLRSDRLSSFHGRDVFMRAMVRLPEAFEAQPDRRFGAIYVIPGFGGDHVQSLMMATMLGKSDVPFVTVGLDATCPLGHHVFADSDNNGPWGRALIEELIPHLEDKFRLIPDARGRFLYGHSSGGWSGLWLQVCYPTVFGGVWAGSPDPVDFHDSCGVNLYDPKANFYVDGDGQPRPLIRRNGSVQLSMKDFALLEDVIGPGGQLHSLEAVFGSRGPAGTPRLLYDRQTGEIDPHEVDAWRRYDIVAKIEREWDALGPKLAGKITVIMGEDDTFYLEGATKRLKSTLARLGSDARVFIVPGKDHGSIIMTKPYRSIIKEMGERFIALEKAVPSTSREAAPAR